MDLGKIVEHHSFQIYQTKVKQMIDQCVGGREGVILL